MKSKLKEIYISQKNNKRLLIAIPLLIIVLSYLIIKAIHKGSDIDIYLNASRRFFNKENIYDSFLYSPIFALLLGPISFLNIALARVIWAIINFVLAIRLWYIVKELLLKNLNHSEKLSTWWTLALVIISLGFLNHNIFLGQITIGILWLTLEGLYQVIVRKKIVLGSLLLALGITIKIIPILGLFYLIMKSKFKAATLCFLFILASLFLPSLFVGHSYNTKMLKDWVETINPSNDNYVFENNNGTQSLNAILPAYFFDFDDASETNTGLKRQIIALPEHTLLVLLQVLRLFILLSGLLLIFYRKNRKGNESLFFYWEFSYLALVTALIFPHQQKYAMLYFVPAGAYMILFVLLVIKSKWKVKFIYKVIASFASVLMLISAIMGRDIVGDALANAFDYYHYFGLVNMVFLVFLLAVKPNFLIELRGKMDLPK